MGVERKTRKPLNFLLSLSINELNAIEGLFGELLALTKLLKRGKKKEVRRELEALFSRTFLLVHLSHGRGDVTVSHQWWKRFLRELEEGPRQRPESVQFPLVFGVSVKAKRSPRIGPQGTEDFTGCLRL